MGKRRVKQMDRHHVGALDRRCVAVRYDRRVTDGDSLRFRVVTASGLELEATFQVMSGVFSVVGVKPTLLDVAEGVEEFYALVATDRPLVRPLTRKEALK